MIFYYDFLKTNCLCDFFYFVAVVIHLSFSQNKNLKQIIIFVEKINKTKRNKSFQKRTMTTCNELFPFLLIFIRRIKSRAEISHVFCKNLRMHVRVCAIMCGEMESNQAREQQANICVPGQQRWSKTEILSRKTEISVNLDIFHG